MTFNRTPKEKVRINCLQCGASIKFPEGDHSVKCPYCSIVLLIIAPNRVLKYYLNTELEPRGLKFITEGYCKRSGIPLPNSVESPRLFYLPFWRFRGSRYWLFIESDVYEFEDGVKLETEPKVTVESKPFDLSFPGADISLMRNAFLGIRAQTVELCPEIPENLKNIANIIKPGIILDEGQ